MNTARTFRFLCLEFLVGGELLVELFLEQPDVLNGGAAQDALIEEMDGLAVDGQHADDPPLDHPVQITGPRFFHFARSMVRVPPAAFCGAGSLGERGVPGQQTTAGQA